MKPFVSVIVPVYRVEDYVKRCLDSLCKQSLHEIEIILVDDASPDRCGEICEEYAAGDARFRVIHHPVNQGLSAARNTGIREACADYLMFVDSDDWVHKDYCRLPYECAVQYGADLVMFKSQEVTRDDNCSTRDSEGLFLVKGGYKTHKEAIDLLLNGSGIYWSSWNKLYNKQLFYDISYPTGFLYEDIGTTYKTVLKSQSIYFLNKALYFHCCRKNSITGLKTKKALQDRFAMDMRQYKDLKAWGYPAENLDVVLKDIAMRYCIGKKRDLSDQDYLFCSNVLKSCKMISEKYIWKRKVLLLLFNYCPPLFELACTLWGKKYGD